MTIKFEILESLNYRGGSHYEYVYADDTNEVMEALKDAWYQSGIHRHGGELFLTAHMNDSDDKETSLFFGHCSVDSDGELYSVFEFPSSESERDDWYKFGLFVEDVDGDYFEPALEAFFDSSSPDRILGSYLYKVNKILPELNSDLKNNIGAYVLADILNFAKLHNKMKQMYEWIVCQEGKNFLTLQDSYCEIGEKVVGFIENHKIDELEAFIEKNKDRVGLQPSFPT
jgi:hypothetical protein